MTLDDITFGPYDKAEHKARQAFELYEDGQISQALQVLEDALEINPANSAWHFNKALTLDSMNRFSDAISEYEIALELNPSDIEILNSLAVDYTRVGQYDLAISVFEQIQQFDQNFEPSYCNRIITYTEMGLHDLAEQMFYLAQQIDPDCALCFYNIGNNLFVRGQYEKAVRCWLRTSTLDPTHPQIDYRIAQAYWSHGQYVPAKEHFLTELRQNPGDIDVILDFGLLLLEVDDVGAAREKFNRIVELTPDCAPALFYLGEIAFNNCEHDLAIDMFHHALRIDNTLTGPCFRLAQYALASGNNEKTKSYLNCEIELKPEHADTLVSMGSMFLIIGELDNATQCLLRSVDIDSTNPEAYYYLGLVSALKGQLEDSAEFFGHALDINPEHISALKDSAVVSLAAGRLENAHDRITKALNLASNDPRLKMISRKIRTATTIEQIRSVLSRFKR